MAISALRRLLFLLALCCAASSLSGGRRGAAHAATVLSEDDARWLLLLQPASRSELPGWLEAHDRLAGEVEAAKAAGGLDVVVYGDSIMEAFRGECLGADWSHAYAANMAAWKRAYEGKRAGIFAICGDQAVHLLWRLREGEGPGGLGPRAIAVMIGTNDAAHLASVYPGEAEIPGHIISLAVQQIVRELQRQAPQATIVVFGLLPLQPQMLGRPDRGYDGITAAANRDLAAFVEAQGSPRLRFKDCSSDFLLPSGEVDTTRMPDGVHPAGEGGELLLKCMHSALEI